MSEFSQKLLEIERNIQEGEKMLAVLSRLPESEETNAQICRFQELIQQLEDFRERYNALKISSVNDLEALEALRDKHNRIKLLLEQSTAGKSNSVEDSQSNTATIPFQTHSYNPSTIRNSENEQINNVLPVDTTEDDTHYHIEPLEWHLHYQVQTSQLSSMLSQIGYFQEMVGRLSSSVISLEMTEVVTFLSDIGQRFTEVHLKLIALQNAYEKLHNHENPSNEFKANQLTDLRGVLIYLGRSLEVTKDCFFSVATIMKTVLGDKYGDVLTPCETRTQQQSDSHVSASIGESRRNISVSSNRSDEEALETSLCLEQSPEQESMESVLANLCKQRDELLNQLAEFRSRTYHNISSSNNETNGLPKLALNESSASIVNGGDSQHTVINVALNTETTGEIASDSLPIIKRLQARKQHLEELRGELLSFSFTNDGDILNAQRVTTDSKTDSIENIPADSFPLLKTDSDQVPPPQYFTSHEAGIALTDPFTSRPDPYISHAQMSSPHPLSTLSTTQGAASANSSDSDVVAPKSEVVTFQEPEATYIDNTERLYKSMREARIAREENRSTPVNGANKAAKGGETAIGSSRFRTGMTSALSESTSCMDATAMGTWGGDSEREDDIEDIHVRAGYVEDDPSIVSSRSSRANKRLLTSTQLSDSVGDPDRELLTERTNSRDPTRSVYLPHLGHSPSPHVCISGSRPMKATTLGELHEPSSPTTEPDLTHRHSATVNYLSVEEHVLNKALAIKLASLEFKVEQLTQTCQLLVVENARLNSAVSALLTNQHHFPSTLIAAADRSAISHNGPTFLSSHTLPIPMTGLLPNALSQLGPAVLTPSSVNGVCSVHSLAPGPSTPSALLRSPKSLEKALEHVQMLAAQVIMQQSSVCQLQNDLRTALQQHLYTRDGDAVMDIAKLSSGSIQNYQTRKSLGITQDSRQMESEQVKSLTLDSLLALQQTAADIAASLQSLQPATTPIACRLVWPQSGAPPPTTN